MFGRWMGLWRKSPTAAPLPRHVAPMPYRVACRCGHVLEGMRQLRRQILTCPKCSSRVFVLPASPWPRQYEGEAVVPASKASRSSTEDGRIWRQPIRAAIITVLLMGLIVIAVLLHLESSDNRTRSQLIRDRTSDGRKALESGSLADAFAALSTATAELQRLPKNFPHKEAAEIQRLHRQVALIHTLMEQSLEEVIAEAKQARVEEWVSRFAEKYAGRAIVFDAYLFPDNKQHVRLDYLVEVEGIAARLELQDFEELETWVSPNQEGQRWIFGLRLASIKLNTTPAHPQGLWTVYFDKESIALVTEPSLLRFLDLSDQRELRNVLDRQRRLVAWQPADQPNLEAIPPGTPGELVRRMKGPPARIARQILAGRHVEQWIYEQPQPIRLRLEHRRGGPLQVTRFWQKLPNLQN